MVNISNLREVQIDEAELMEAVLEGLDVKVIKYQKEVIK